MKQPFSTRLEAIPPSGIRRFFELVLSSQNVISLGVGEPDFMTPWAVRNEAIQTLVAGQTAYTANRGLKACRDAISDYMKTRFACTYDADSELVVTVGGSEGLDLTLRALLNEGDEVIIPEPCFVCYKPLVMLAGARAVSLDTSSTQFIPDPEAVAKLITPQTKAILLCNPSNPTGKLIPKEILEAISKLAKEHDFWIISDEIYAELIYDGTFVSAGSLEGIRDRVAVINGFSKAFSMTGWRLGFLCGPEPLISRATKIHQYCIMSAPTTSQFAGVKAIHECLGEVESMRKSYQLRRDFLESEFNRLGLETVHPEGAFYCFPSIQSTGLTSEEFAMELLKQQSVAVVPGSAFGECGEGYIRCCYATSMEHLKEAASRIEAFLKSLKK